MFKSTVLIIWAVGSFYFNTTCATSAARPKRVIDGGVLSGRHMGYDAVRYYTWISNGHECDMPAPDFLKNWFGLHEKWEFPTSLFGFQCRPTPNRLMCSGALIAPKIVQTACHCLAEFVEGGRQDGIRTARLFSHWESLFRIYLGANRVDLMNWGIPSRAYFVHDKCIEFRRLGDMLIYDYGWLSLPKNVDEFAHRLHLHAVDYAPMYTIKELVHLWHHTMSKSLVCLYIGFGGYRLIHSVESSEKSPVLLHAWHNAMTYTACDQKIRPPFTIAGFNYTRDATWICTQTFTGSTVRPGRGDSGGPVTCDNQYIAIVSQKRLSCTFNMAVAFAVFQNAIEFRNAFITAMDLDRNYGVDVPTLMPTPI